CDCDDAECRPDHGARTYTSTRGVPKDLFGSSDPFREWVVRSLSGAVVGGRGAVDLEDGLRSAHRQRGSQHQGCSGSPCQPERRVLGDGSEGERADRVADGEAGQSDSRCRAGGGGCQSHEGEEQDSAPAPPGGEGTDGSQYQQCGTGDGDD